MIVTNQIIQEALELNNMSEQQLLKKKDELLNEMRDEFKKLHPNGTDEVPDFMHDDQRRVIKRVYGGFTYEYYPQEAKCGKLADRLVCGTTGCDRETLEGLPKQLTCLAEISGPFFPNPKGVESLSLPFCEILSDDAFSYFTDLETIYLPKADIIPQNAFYGCTSLKEIDLPSCEKVEFSAFSSGSKEEGEFDYDREDEDIEVFAYGDGLCDVPDYCVCLLKSGFCRNLEKVNLPVCKIIDEYAFYGCKNLKNVTVPKTCLISPDAFGGCDKLQLNKI